MPVKDRDIILLKVAHRLKPGDLKRIIDDAISRKGRHPLEDYYALVKELKKFKNEN